ncbi:hypothetical protein NDU88_004678 [Pleurodeles waltl]|uniref:Uncharacterized protein n=1 Tax=Pleurodeles waltl TaxID=8319 RepID=A0AAV7NMZ3_PLEWA|nr:hypothetical protein NDU88_004678 [Pleurodeles waltl]
MVAQIVCYRNRGIPDPDVLRAGTNQQKLPGNDRQQQQLRAFPRIKKVGDGDDGATVADGESGKVEQGGEEQLKEEDECRGGDGGDRIYWSSPGEVLTSGTPGISPDRPHREVGRGPGGSVPIRWPRSGESVAFSGGKERVLEVTSETGSGSPTLFFICMGWVIHIHR